MSDDKAERKAKIEEATRFLDRNNYVNGEYVAPPELEAALKMTDRVMIGFAGKCDRLEAEKLANAFDHGWTALRLQYDAQKADPRHPITRINPWRSEGQNDD